MASLSSTTAAQRLDDEAGRAPRTQDPDGVKRNILEVAKQEFAAKGFSGARVDEIAARTRTSKRMLYYYFGDKEGLYMAALEDVYLTIRAEEANLDLDRLEPAQALATLTAFTFDHQNANPAFVRIVMNENILGARFLDRSAAVRAASRGAIDALTRIIARGQKSGIFRKPLTPVDLHMTISALAFFNVANRATFSSVFTVDMASPAALAVRRAQAVETVLRYARRDGATAKTRRDAAAPMRKR